MEKGQTEWRVMVQIGCRCPLGKQDAFIERVRGFEARETPAGWRQRYVGDTTDHALISVDRARAYTLSLALRRLISTETRHLARRTPNFASRGRCPKNGWASARNARYEMKLEAKIRTDLCVCIRAGNKSNKKSGA
jgi:hypothetical protein